MKIKRVWILGAPSFEMDKVKALLDKAGERFFLSSVPAETLGWRPVRSKREAFSDKAHGVIGDLYPEYVYFVECAQRVFYPRLIHHEEKWPIYASFTDTDIVSEVRSELKRLGK